MFSKKFLIKGFFNELIKMGWKGWKYSSKGAIIATIMLFFYPLLFGEGLSVEFFLVFFYSLPFPLIFGGLIGSIYGDIKEKEYRKIGFWIKVILLVVLIILSWIFVNIIRKFLINL